MPKESRKGALALVTIKKRLKVKTFVGRDAKRVFHLHRTIQIGCQASPNHISAPTMYDRKINPEMVRESSYVNFFRLLHPPTWSGG